MAFVLGLLGATFTPLIAQMQSPQMPDLEAITAEYGKIVSEISNKESLKAADHADFARQTLALGQATLQSGQPIVETSVHDALLATDLGEKANAFETDWETLRNDLKALLEPPPEQDQQQQDQQNQDQQENQENSEDQQQQDQQNQDGSEGENQEQSQDQQEGENQESQDQQSEGDQNQESQDQQSQDSQQSDQNAQPKETQNLGDMEQPQGDISLDEQPPPQPQQMQQIGGAQQDQEPLDAQTAMALQQLEKIKQQDDPGRLHMLLQQAETDENQKNTSQKDW